MAEEGKEPVPLVEYKEERRSHRITVTGSWFPKRDDVQGVIRLRKHFAEKLPQALFALRDDVYLDVYVTPEYSIDIDRALTGCMTALDGQHGNISAAALWDDSVIRQARMTRIGMTRIPLQEASEKDK